MTLHRTPIARRAVPDGGSQDPRSQTGLPDSGEGRRWFGARTLLASLKRVTIFCGGYGSGKTEVAVNFAVHLAASGVPTKVGDLDIVNPYFRSREVRQELRRRGVEVLVPDEALVEADLPIIKPEIRGAIETGEGHLVLDLGGDPAGARVMASLAGVLREGSYDGLFAVNSRRPFTSTATAAIRMMDGITAAAGFRITGLVVNSHLIEETTAETIDEGIGIAEEIEKRAGVPVAFVAVERRMLLAFDARRCRHPVMVMERLMLKPWEEPERPGSRKFRP